MKTKTEKGTKRFLSAVLVIGLFPAALIKAAAAEPAEACTLSDDYISVSVSKRNGGFTVKTVEGDRLKNPTTTKTCCITTDSTTLRSSRSAWGRAAAPAAARWLSPKRTA